MILRQGERGLELLFIQRALFPNDPWSGNIAFPGGKAKPGEALKQAAEREAAEEVGLDLAETVYLGRLPEVTGSTLRLVSPVLFTGCPFVSAANSQSGSLRYLLGGP
jgi:8-oxo-dGTP pyrophosphatase MutT (NUDIX family)